MLCWDGKRWDGCGAIDAFIHVENHNLVPVLSGESSLPQWSFRENKVIIGGQVVEVVLEDHVFLDRVYLLPKQGVHVEYLHEYPSLIRFDDSQLSIRSTERAVIRVPETAVRLDFKS